MASLICFMFCDLSLPAADTIFASDAQGAGELSTEDAGGFGIVAASVPKDLVLDCWRSSFMSGRTIAKLDGSLGTKFKSKVDLKPTVPFSRLPAPLFERDRLVLAQGRWNIIDHINLGEARGHFRIFQGLAAHPDTHNHRVLALQDNMATSGSMTKGRSPAPALNYYCRRRAAACIAANIVAASPWIETTLQPADDASRDRAANGPEVSRRRHREPSQGRHH